MTLLTKRINEYTALAGIVKELKAIVARESKRPQGCEDLTPSMLALLEEEIIPALENELNWEPSDTDLGYGSEPPLTADERHTAAWQQHQAMHN